MNSLKQIFKLALKNNATRGMTWKEYQQYAADRGITDAQLRNGNLDARRLANQFFYGTQPITSLILGAPIGLESPDIIGSEVPVLLIQEPIAKTVKTTTKKSSKGTTTTTVTKSPKVTTTVTEKVTKSPKGITTTTITEEAPTESLEKSWNEGLRQTSKLTRTSDNSSSLEPKVSLNMPTKKSSLNTSTKESRESSLLNISSGKSSYTPNNRIYTTLGVTTSPAGYSGDGNGPIHKGLVWIGNKLYNIGKLLWSTRESAFSPNSRLYLTLGRSTISNKQGGTLNKYLQGGQATAELNEVMKFVKALAQTLQADPNQIILAALLNPEALRSAAEVYNQTLDIQLAAQAFAQALQSQAQAAKHGAKLNYLKALKNQCAEDEELVYFKKGGKVDCGCKKKEDGGEIKEESPISKFKKMAKGDKVPLKFVNPNDTVHVNGKTYSLVNSDGSRADSKFPAYKGKVEEEDRKKAKAGNKDSLKRQTKQDLMSSEKKGGNLKKDCGGSKLKKGDKVCPKCGKVHAAGAGCMLSSVKKFKMHKYGGSLNGIPFYLEGTTEGGIKYYPEDEFSGWDLVPFVGTARDIRRAYHNPNVQTIGTAAVSTAADVLGGGMLGMFGRGLLKSARFAKKLKRLGYVPITKNGGNYNTYVKVGTKAKPSFNIEPVFSVHNVPTVDYTPVVNTMMAPIGRVSNYALWGVPTLK